MDKSKLLMIATGKGPKMPELDGEGHEDEGQDSDEGSDPSALDAADELIQAIRSKDAQGVVDAFKALSVCADGEDMGSGE